MKGTTKITNVLNTQLPLILALLIIAGILIVWKPWDQQVNAAERTISVTGESEISAVPDEYLFNPQYETQAADKATALADSTAKTNEVVSRLKSLGVQDKDIKTDTNGYQDYWNSSDQTYSAYLSVTVHDKQLAQKVQDYLLTTDPSGSVSPSATFSKAKAKQLADTGRDRATTDARRKAEQSAKNLGFKLGKVKSVSDGSGDVAPHPYLLNAADAAGATTAKAESLPIQVGQNDTSYQVTVVYYLR